MPACRDTMNEMLATTGTENRNSKVTAFHVVFAGLGFLSILPFWTVRYPVLTDYPHHLARWFVLRNIHDSAFHFSSYYTPDWGPHPYILSDVLGVLLQFVFPIDIAGRCILSLCLLAIPLATLFFLRRAAPENEHLSIFAFLIAFNPIMLMGFVESQLSLALCIFVIGLWLSFCKSPKMLTAIGVAVGIVFVYLAHLIGFAIVGIALGSYCLLVPKPVKRLFQLALLSIPGLLLFLYNAKRTISGGHLTYQGLGISEKLRSLAFPIRIFSRVEDAIVLLGMLVILLLLFRSRHQIHWQKPMLITCLVLLGVYFISPGEYGRAGYIDVRILPLVYLLALAAFRLERVPRNLIAAILAIVLFRFVTVEKLFVEKQKVLETRTAAFLAIPPGSRVLPLVNLARIDTLVGRADVHHIAYGVMQKGFLVPTICYLSGFQGLQTTGAGYCPNAFCEVESPAETDWSKVAEFYDYLWVDHFPAVESFARSIAEPVFSNEYVTVYRVKKSVAQ
jgi:hypothetical protein